MEVCENLSIKYPVDKTIFEICGSMQDMWECMEIPTNLYGTIYLDVVFQNFRFR